VEQNTFDYCYKCPDLRDNFILYVWLGQGATLVGKSIFSISLLLAACVCVCVCVWGSQSEAAVYRCL
jgi:hypothetical protein